MLNLPALTFAMMLRVLGDSGEVLPWVGTLPDSAAAIAQGCEARPLPGGGPEWCAAVLVTQSWHESRFNPEAVGDSGAAKGLFQVHAATLGRPIANEQSDQVGGAIDLLVLSFQICRAHPLDERLAWFAAGGQGCDRRLPLSRFRLHQAARLLRTVTAAR